MTSIFQDWRVNQGNRKAQLVLVFFRIAQSIQRKRQPIFLLGIPYLVFYGMTIRWILSTGIPWNTQAGLIIWNDVDIGANVIVVGPITLGSSARNGADSIAVKNVSAGATVAVDPERAIHLAATLEAKYA
jgi:putative colanic acid biosynthesis acetyltransferase WcaB